MIFPFRFDNPVLIPDGKGNMVFAPYWQKQFDDLRTALNALTAATDEYTPTIAVETRTFDSSTVTLPELGDVVGTLIQDLQGKEILG